MKGDDADLFKISDKGLLAFKAAPDYEEAKDKDNVYNVTITATDKAGAKAEYALAVTVANVVETTGTSGNAL